MKRIAITPFLLSIFLLSFFVNCKKEQDKTPIEQLPPETQTGANTFGCLVNGQTFKPGGAQLSGGSLQANYQNLGVGPDGGYYLAIIGRYRNNSNGSGKSIGLFSDSVMIQENRSYNLITREKGKFSGSYSFYSSPTLPYELFETEDSIYTGTLNIKKIDTVTQVMSGTFWFKAVNSVGGDTVNVTDGRFDVRYTR